jgi:UDP-N-acetylglucosamine transferase subunit ALG13
MTTVFATVGTERYPFDRLVGWVDRWAGSLPAPAPDRAPVRCVIQYGTARPPEHAEGHDYLPFDRVRELLAEADVVVCHGGTGSVILARSAGRLPVVVPRLGSAGEHVDDHQVEFARRLAGLGELVAAEDEDRLRGLLDAAVAGDRSFRIAGPDSSDGRAAEAVERFAELVDGLFRPAGRGGDRR